MFADNNKNVKDFEGSTQAGVARLVVGRRPPSISSMNRSWLLFVGGYRYFLHFPATFIARAIYCPSVNIVGVVFMNRGIL